MDSKNRFIQISRKWCYDAPFLSMFSLNFDYVPDENLFCKDDKGNKIPTMGIGFIGKKFKLVYHPDCLEKFSDEILEGVMLHEVMHLLTFSHKRGINRMARVWNVATDIVNNDEILTKFTIGGRSMKLPDWGCFLKDIVKDGYKGKVIAEDIYEWLKDNKVKYVTFDDHSQLDNLDPNDIEVQMTIDSLKKRALSQSWGSMSGDMVDRIKQLLKPERIPFEKLFRKAISKLQEKGSKKSYSWKKVNRRHLPLKGKTKIKSRLIVVQDTSGSCYDEHFFKKFYSEIDNLSERYEIILYQIDVKVTSKQIYKKGCWRKIEMKGGGGTIMQPIFDRLKEDKLTNVPVVFFTDSDFDTKFDMYGTQVYWVLTHDTNDPIFKHKYVFKDVA